jgi:hypothetical protein
VLVRPPARSAEPIAVEDPKALPVRAGGAMYLEVQLDEPAFAYLVWIDCTGRVAPLYPWNNETIEVTDLNQVPPVRRATNRIFSPMLGRDWQFDEGSGLETVLLLVRRTALPEGSKPGDILKDLSVPPLRDPGELLMLSLGKDEQQVKTIVAKNRGDDEQARAADQPLLERLRQLGEHFDFVQAVRFAHADGSAPASP